MIKNVFFDYYKEHTHKEKILLFTITIIISFILTFLFPSFSSDFVSSLIAAYSIFIGFLFNLVIMLANMAKDINVEINEPRSRTNLKNLKLDVIERGLKIISASILIAVINIIFMLIHVLDWVFIELFFEKYFLIFKIFNCCFIFLSYFFLVLFLDSLCKILKITYILLQKDVELKRKELK